MEDAATGENVYAKIIFMMASPSNSLHDSRRGLFATQISGSASLFARRGKS